MNFTRRRMWFALKMQSLRELAPRASVTLIGLFFLMSHLLCPMMKMDWIGVVLLGIALLPWIYTALQSIEVTKDGLKIVTVREQSVEQKEKRAREDAVQAIEVGTIARNAEKVHLDSADVERYKEAESLALAYLNAAEFGGSMQVGVVVENRDDLAFDAIGKRKSRAVFIEVKLITRPEVPSEILKALIGRAKELALVMRQGQAYLLVAFVTDMSEDDHFLFESRINNLRKFSSDECLVEVRILSLGMLKSRRSR